MTKKIFEGTVEKIVSGGWGLVGLEGRKVFVPLVLPGEVIQYQIQSTHEKVWYGDLIKVLKPSPYREKPKCLYFGSCGGGSFQHINYSEQLRVKKEIFLDSLRRNGRIENPPMLDPIGSQEIFNYRCKVNLKANRLGEVGFYGRGSHEVVPIARCEIAMEAMNDYLPIIQAKAKQAALEKVREYELDFELKVVAGKVVEGNRAEGEFVQVNPGMNQLMKDELAKELQKLSAKHCLELYSGAGNFTEILAAQVSAVVAVEANALLTNQAKQKLSHDQDRIEFLAQTAKLGVEAMKRQERKFDLIFLDPPRRGALEVLAGMAILKPRTIIYVSCNPDSLARDLQYLLEHGYRLEKIQPFDFFPQTPHIESLSVLQQDVILNPAG